MLFITGLLALLAISNAGGDHHIKGGGHIKGGDAHHSASAQQVAQEALAPSPYSFNIDTSASYGAKIVREETGDAEGRVKGSYSISGPRGTTRVVQYTADETGFHANVKTSEPNVETHSPANARIEAVSKKGGSASMLIPVPDGVATGPFLRDPIAVPVANQPALTAVKTVKTLTSASGQQTIKTVDKSVQPGAILVETKTPQAKVAPVRKGSGNILPGPIGSGGQQIGGAREVIVYDDGTIVDVGSVSGNAGTSSNLQPLLGGISSGPILKAGGQLAGGAREVIVYEDGTIEEVGNLGEGATKSAVYTEDKAKNAASLTNVQKSAIRTGSKPDLKTQRRPAVTVPRPGSGIPVVSAPKPIVPVQNIQSGVLGDNIKMINRQLIQRQNQEGVLQTFGGVAKSESDLTGLSISLEQLGGYGTGRPIAPKIQLKQPATLTKPKLPKPSVTSAADRSQTFKYTGNRVTSGILGSSAPRVISGQNRVSQTQGYGNQYVVGNAAGLIGSSDDIKRINQQLIQRQNQEGVLQTFGSVAKSESDLTGLSVSLEQLGGYGASRPVAPAIQLRQPVAVPKPQLPKPSVTSAADRSQTFKYTGNRVTSGILGSSAPRIIPGQNRVSQTQGYGNQYVVGNAAGLIGSSDDIKRINQQLIQKQNQEGVLQTFGSVAKSESDLTGLSVSLEQLGGYGASRPVAPAIQLRQPVAVPKPQLPKPSVTSAANRDQTFKYTGNRVTSGILGSSAPRIIPGQIRVSQNQGYGNQYIIGNSAGSIGSSDDIKLINRQLIQRQNEEGVIQAFGGVVKSEADLTGLPVSLEQFGAYGVNRPVVPAIQLRKPVEVPKARAPKPAAVSTTGKDQTFKYTGNRVTSGILGSSSPRVIPGQTTGSILQTQGYNKQFTVGNAAGSIASSDDIKLINRQLIQRQNEEGVLQAFGGVVKSESDLTGLPVSLEQFGGYGGIQPISPAVQLRQPAPVTKPKQPARVTSTIAGRDQIFRQISSTKPTIPSQGVSQISVSDNIKLINQQLIQKQANEGFSQTFGGIVKSDSDIGRVSLTSDQLRGLSQLSGYNTYKPAVPSLQSVGGLGITTTEQKLKYTPSRPAPVSPPARVAPVPKPKAPAQILPQGDDIITLNRGLIQKQNEQGVLQAFGGIVKSEDDLDGISVSLEQLQGMSPIAGYGANIPQAQQAPKRPVNVAPKRPSLTSSQASRQPTATRVDQNAQGFGIRTSSAQSFAPARTGPQNALTSLRTSSGNQRTATRTSSDASITSSQGNVAQISGTSSAFGSSAAGQAAYSQGGLSGDLVNINRQLIEKQNREGIQQAFGGIIKSEADLEDGLVYVDELDAITKLVGYNTAGEQGPQPYGYSSSGQSGINQAQEAGKISSAIEQSRITTGLMPAGSPDIQIAGQDDNGQLQVKIDDIAEPSSLSRGKDSSNIPSIQSLVSETFKQIDLQENIPVEIQSYVPPMRPYNYRTQVRASSSDSPNVQEQQKIEQIFV